MRPKKSNNKTHVLASTKTSDLKIHQTALHMQYVLEYGINVRDRIITLAGDIDAPMFDLVEAGLTEMEQYGKGKVIIKIFSHGGAVSEAMAIIGRLRSSKCYIETQGFGAIHSAATLILACGDRRKMSEYSTFMHHEASYGLNHDRHSSHKATINQIEKEEQLWCKWMARFSKVTAERWLELSQNTDKYFTPDQILQLGVIDEII